MGWAVAGRLILLVKNIDYKRVYKFVVCLDGGYNGVSTIKTESAKKVVRSHLSGLSYKSTIKIELRYCEQMSNPLSEINFFNLSTTIVWSLVYHEIQEASALLLSCLCGHKDC